MNETTPTFPAEPEKGSHKSSGEKQVVGHGFSQDRPFVTPFGLCQCGCGKPLRSAGRGTARKWASRACKTRVWRRNRHRALTCEGRNQTQGRLAR